jgi:NAD(P)H-hydrate repair Nnr-like enzyme with NAD(P)H-hydrate dehydratase domain
VGVVEGVLHHASDTAVVVVDAAALRALRSIDATLLRRLAGRLVLTPNRQEVGPLVEDFDDALPPTMGDADLLADVARQNGAVVTSFGSVRAWDGRGWDVVLGHPSLGTSGSGDVLAGMVAGLVGRSGDPAQAACWATYAHAATGEHLGRRCGHLGFLARELIDEVGAVMRTAVGPSDTYP